jgi:NAD(P)-dependent dehydrogenase (short-subunit alcohol dehydrogenase family)
MAIALTGPFLLTNLMLPTLEKSAPSRVIIVSSGGALTQKMDLSDPQFTRGKWDGSRAYSQTKVRPMLRVRHTHHTARTTAHDTRHTTHNTRDRD